MAPCWVAESESETEAEAETETEAETESETETESESEAESEAEAEIGCYRATRGVAPSDLTVPRHCRDVHRSPGRPSLARGLLLSSSAR